MKLRLGSHWGIYWRMWLAIREIGSQRSLGWLTEEYGFYPTCLENRWRYWVQWDDRTYPLRSATCKWQENQLNDATESLAQGNSSANNKDRVSLSRADVTWWERNQKRGEERNGKWRWAWVTKGVAVPVSRRKVCRRAWSGLKVGVWSSQ